MCMGTRAERPEVDRRIRYHDSPSHVVDEVCHQHNQLAIPKPKINNEADNR